MGFEEEDEQELKWGVGVFGIGPHRKACPLSEKGLDFNSVPKKIAGTAELLPCRAARKQAEQRQQLGMETPIKSFKQQMGKARLSF